MTTETTPSAMAAKEQIINSLKDFLSSESRDQAMALLDEIHSEAYRKGLSTRHSFNTPYLNTIPVDKQPPYPGDRKIERRIKSIIRWNAMAMVVRANRNSVGIGGHISTYASSATLFEVAFNHFLRGRTGGEPGDQVFFQGHASPGIYARAYVEGRLSVEKLRNFRRELAPGGGLSSYPHPWLMPDFWETPSVSMGLPILQAIYQARFNCYLQDRGILNTENSRVWAFVGDGEMDEPESLGALTVASREQLDNLSVIVNCNLQRLDGPVRGNGKIVQELEAIFRGAGWNVIKVIWGSDWDPLLAQDTKGLLLKRMDETVDGEYQKYTVEEGDYVREMFFGVHPDLLAMVEHLSDDELHKLKRGGHDPAKVYAAFNAAVHHKGQPTVILAKTIKGYGLGEAGEGRNISHQQKKLNEEELKVFRDRFSIPIKDEELAEAPFYRPKEGSEEFEYIQERRKALGGFIPNRSYQFKKLAVPGERTFRPILSGSAGRPASTTVSFGRLISQLMRDKEIGNYIVPIVPDEARTFGLDSLFRQYGIYSRRGQKYQPVDFPGLLYYREATDGQLIEEGITEAGAMSSFIAAGTSYCFHNRPMIPFFMYYSMFGFQRIGDLIWAAADQRVRGFLLGATAGRTSLAGEGLQHQDGHSHLAATTIPNLMSYDPAFGCELAVIVRDGIHRMYENDEDVFYYITVMNDNYEQPELLEGSEEGILNGMYLFKASENRDNRPRVRLLGSGAILIEALRAQEILESQFGVSADVWSVTSYKELSKDGSATDRWNLLHPGDEAKVSYVTSLLEDEPIPTVAASDNVRLVPESIRPWIPGPYAVLGTDGFGRSEARKELRRFFEVDTEFITLAALFELVKRGDRKKDDLSKAIQTLGIDPEKSDPFYC